MLDAGTCLLTSRPRALDLHATAADPDGLGRVMDVIGRHLERFGRRHELRVEWTRGCRASPAPDQVGELGGRRIRIR